jgi:diacylglycerol kinase family enzyme
MRAGRWQGARNPSRAAHAGHAHNTPMPSNRPPSEVRCAPPAVSIAAPLIVVFNLGSGAGDAAQARAAIESACADAGRKCTLLRVDDPRQLGALARDAVQRAQAAGGVVVAAGGDGTLNAVAQAVLGSGCAFGVLPQGTFNYFSRTHGIPADIAAALQVLLHEQAHPVQIGLVNERVFLVNASLGLYPKLLEDREVWKKQFGRNRLVAFGAGLSTLLRGQRSLRLHIDVHGRSHEVRSPTLFVGNNALQLEQLGLAEAQAVDRGALAAILLRPVGRAVDAVAAAARRLRPTGRGRPGAEASRSSASSFAAPGPSPRWRIKVATDGEILWLPLPLEFRRPPSRCG